MLPGTKFTPEDILGILLRRRWLVLLPFALGLLLVPAIASRLPELYRSETMIMVVPQRVPDTYVRSTVTGTVEDRLPSISDQILSRSRLERVIEDFDLYPELRAEAPMEDVVARMRADVGEVSIRSGQQAFVVGFTSQDPVTAQKVTARLASLLIDENTRDRETQAESTNVFLETQLEQAERDLIAREKALESYRKTHAGELPAERESNLQAIQSAQLQLQGINDRINSARQRQLVLESQLADARRPLALPLTAGGRPDPASLSAAQQLELARSELDGMRLRLGARHPEIRAQERKIAELDQKAREEASRSPDDTARTSPEEQVRQRTINDLMAQLDVIELQLESGQAEADRLRRSIEEYERRIAAAPTRESELMQLTRDYDVLKGNYEELVKKKSDSELSAEVERRQIGEQFRVLDAASLPERPSNGLRRFAMAFSAAGLGLLLGLALTALLEYRDVTFARGADLERLLDLPVLALVPTMASEKEHRRARARRLAFDVAASAVVVVSAGVVVVWGLSL